MKIQPKDPGPGHYETLKPLTKAGGSTGFSFSRDMRSFDKIARDELRNAIKYKEQEYVSQFAKM